MKLRLEDTLINAVLYSSIAIVLIFFYIPIFTLIVFSFKEGRFLTVPFDGFTLDWYGKLFDNREIGTAMINSAVIATVTMVLATALGTAAALVWLRYEFPGKKIFQALVSTPLFFPQLLLGIVLLIWFSVLGQQFDFSLGMPSIIIGHVVYLLPFALVVTGVQIAAFDPTLERAARDCGATTWQVYREVTLPIIWPGIFSAAIFVFLMSWGNFYLTYSLNGTVRTLPTFIFSGIAVGSSPLYPALATVIFVPALILVIVADVLRRRALRGVK
ncbi:MAG: ABC transporter permease [Rhodospirillales bacterium]|nr:ABC transporter permease [Rhodospirillales bacterium]